MRNHTLTMFLYLVFSDLGHFYMATRYMKMDNTSWTYSIYVECLLHA